MNNIMLDNNTQLVKNFKFTPEDVNKFIVVKMRYKEYISWKTMLPSHLKINNHEMVHNQDMFFGVYKIEWHSDLQKHENDMSYKVKLTPVGDFRNWCPNRSWYTSDMENHIENTYDLFVETPIFSNLENAVNFALKKNKELYPDNRSKFQKIIDYIFNR